VKYTINSKQFKKSKIFKHIVFKIYDYQTRNLKKRKKVLNFIIQFKRTNSSKRTNILIYRKINKNAFFKIFKVIKEESQGKLHDKILDMYLNNHLLFFAIGNIFDNTINNFNGLIIEKTKLESK